MEDMSIIPVVGLAAFIAGTAFGVIANRTNFCTMGAISDWVFMDDTRRLRAWFLAIAVAALGTQLLHAGGIINIDTSVYRTANFGWLGAILGGLMFGFGMTMGGGCGNKTLLRIGGGNLKSIYVFLVMGVSGYMTMRGLIALGRMELERTNLNLRELGGLPSQGMDAILAGITGLDPEIMRWVVALAVVLGIVAWCFRSADFRASPRDIFAGVAVGLLIPIGWGITGFLGDSDLELPGLLTYDFGQQSAPLASFTFVGPSGDSINYLMTATGGMSLAVAFGVLSVFGVIFGSFVASIATKSFHWEAFSDTPDMMRHTVGALLMGVGAVLAMGCTIGQGITGMSTLALGSVLALTSIIIGGLYGMKYMEEGTLVDAFKALIQRG